MKIFNMVMLILMFSVRAFADCNATPEQCKSSWDSKAIAVKARDMGDYKTAALKFEEASASHPMEVYKALDLLNAEGCLVGVWSPSRGYLYKAEKATANKAAAQTLLDQVKTLLATVKADKCKYDNKNIAKAEDWLATAQDALNGVFH